jgi:hypothetical protein
MESIKEKVIQEINQTPVNLLPEVLDFVLFLNQKYRQTKPVTPKGWQPGFFEEVIGGWQGEKLVRDIQPEYEQREELQ